VVAVAKPAPQQQQLNNDAKKELQKLKTKFKTLEETVEKLNKSKTSLEAALANPDIYSDKQKFIKAEADYNKAAQDLAAANKEYELLFEKIMELEG